MTLADVVAGVLWSGSPPTRCSAAPTSAAASGTSSPAATGAGARRGALIDLAIGPVWEANHVWLIFAWSCCGPVRRSSATIVRTLFVPLLIAALGIVLRGAGFAFRHVTTTFRARRAYGVLFASSSVIVPFVFGCVAGGIASGRVAADAPNGTLSTWINPTSLLGGVLAVVTCAFLAATFLVRGAAERDDPGLVRYFSRRAVASGVATGVVALAGVFVLAADSTRLFDRLTGVALPLVVLSGLGGVGAMIAVVSGRAALARVLGVGAVVAVIWGWGVAQWPYLLPEVVTVADAAAPDATLWALVLAVALVTLIVGPALYLLLRLTEREVFDTDDLGALALENQPGSDPG